MIMREPINLCFPDANLYEYGSIMWPVISTISENFRIYKFT